MSADLEELIVWQNGVFKPVAAATVNVLSHSLHYGSAVFEGTRAYETAEGPAVFRLDDHLKRLHYSANLMGMTLPYSQSELRDITLTLIQKNGYPACYLRHLAYYGHGKLRVMPTEVPVEMAIACWPWGTYLSDDPIAIKISPYIRIHKDSTVPDAKIAGHYVNCILSGLTLRGTAYQEALFLDAEGYISEVGAANFFIVKDRAIYTPPLGTILDGITRNTVIELARSMGYEVFEEPLKPEQVYAADEAFLTGTAAEVTFVASLEDRPIGDPAHHPVARALRSAYMAVVRGENPDFRHYLTYLPKS